MKTKPRVLSFFSGAMGMDQGLEKAGFEILLACDSDPHCQKTIQMNRPLIPVLHDIQNCTSKEIRDLAKLREEEEIDLIVGGPPCQAFSTAGKRSSFGDERGNVFLVFLQRIFDLQPTFFVIENVRGLLSAPFKHRPVSFQGDAFPALSFDEQPGGALHFVLSWIEKSGYTCSFHLYNAANFGTPQSRDRVILIGSKRKEKPPYLIQTHSETGENGLLPWRTFRQATEGLKNHSYVKFPQKRMKFYEMLKEGQNWRSLPEDLQKEALGKAFYSGGGKTGFLRRLSWDKPAPTLLTHPAMQATDLAHPDEPRPLSIEEYKRLQEFPDDWQLSGGLSEQYRQIGNAVPVGLGFAIGTLLFKLLNSEQVPQTETSHFSRYAKTSDTAWKTEFSNAREKSATLDLFDWALKKEENSQDL